MVVKEIKGLFILGAKYVALYAGAIAGAYVALFSVAYRWFTSGSGKILSYRKRELPPSILNDPVYGQHVYQQIKHVKLHYVENGDRSKPLMLFLHGFPDFWFGWREQIKYFSSHYWTVAIDMRGYGDSEKPYGSSEYRVNYLVDDVKNFLQSLGRDKCILVAHDWGAAVGWRFIAQYPEMVETYIMIGIPPHFAPSFHWIQIFRSWYMFFFQLPILPELWLQSFDMEIFDFIYGANGKEIIEAYKFTFGKSGGFTGGLNYYRGNLISSFRRRERTAADIKLPPGLLLYTDNDTYIDIALFEGAKNVPNLKMELLKGAGHFIHQHKPDVANKVMGQYLGIEVGEQDGKPIQSNPI